MGYYKELNKLIEGKEYKEAMKILDEEWKNLEKEEQELENVEKTIEKIDQTQESIDTIRECVDELLATNDLTQTDKDTLKRRILTIIACFNYLKEKNKEYKQAKELIMSIGEKHPNLYDYCKNWVESPLLEYDDINFSKTKVILDKNKVETEPLNQSLDKKIEILRKEIEKDNSKNQIAAKSSSVIDKIKDWVNEILSINEKDSEQIEKELYSSKAGEIISLVIDLKERNKEYEEAKELIMSIGKKHSKLYNWCKEFIEKPIPEYDDFPIKEVELNISKSNEYKIKDKVKVVFDYKEVKEYATKQENAKKEGTLLKFGELNYKVICDNKEYKFRNYIENYKPNQESDPKCPYKVYSPAVKIDENGDYIVTFHIMPLEFIEK